MKRLFSVLMIFIIILTLSSCAKKDTEETNSKPVVVLPESSMVTVTVDTESEVSKIEANFIGNKNSKVYHKPDCTSVQKMKENNKVGFESAKKATESGYTPCGNCLK